MQSALIGVFSVELAFTHVPHESPTEGWNSATGVVLLFGGVLGIGGSIMSGQVVGTPGYSFGIPWSALFR